MARRYAWSSFAIVVGVWLGLVLLGGPQVLWSQPQIPMGGFRFIPLADITVTNAATVLEGQRGDRVGLVCTNNDGAVNVRIGDSTVTATAGVRLKAGASITATSRASIQAISEGANVTLSCTSERL